MPSYNHCTLVGNLTKDPELRYTPKGTAIAEIGLAINRRWKDEGGQQKESTTYCDITFFGRSAEIIKEYCKKGHPLLLSGRLETDEWNDKQTGQKRTKLKIVGETFQLLSGKESSGEREQQNRPPSENRPPPTKDTDPDAPSDSEIPF